MKPRVRRFGKSIWPAAAIAVLVSALLAGAAYAQTAGEKPVYVPNEYIVHAKPGTTVDQVKQMVARLGATLTEVLPVKDNYLITLGRNGGGSTSRGHYRISATPWTIDRIQPNYFRYIAAIPDDPYWDRLWGMRMINAPAAWEVQKGSSSVIVSVNDTGVGNHPDLLDRIVTGGYDFIDDDDDPSNDLNGHGTHVSGTIAGQGNNGIGVVGVCWNGVKILPVRIFDADGSATSDNIIKGLDWSLNHGAKVVNMSYGMFVSDPIEYDKIKELDSAGIILVAAAGNESTDLPHYPSAYPEVISVSALDPYENLSSFSNFGKIDIAAPGGDQSSFGEDAGIYSAWVEFSTATPPVATYSYKAIQGTSMACPHVAGAAALLLSAGVAPEEVRGRLLSSARPPKTGAMDITKYGAGILDLRAAIAAASINIVQPEKGSTVRSAPDFKITIMGIDTSTVKVFLDYPDVDDDGIPDNLSDNTYVVVDGANVSYYLNTTRTAIAFGWPLAGKSALVSGKHLVYVTAKSSVDGSTVYDWGTFNVSSRQISAGIHLVSFPYQFASASSDGSVTMSALPSNLLLDASGRPVRFSGTGSTRNAMTRWIPKTSVARSTPYFSYSDDKAASAKTFSEKLAWDNPHDLTWYTGGGYPAGQPTAYNFPAGTGYWLFLGQDSMINESYQGQMLSATNAFNIYLYDGWNMIGNPFGRDLAWGSALFTYRGEGPKSLLDAEAAGWIKSTLYGWNSSQGRYEPVTGRDMLEAYNGYWLRAMVGGTSATDSLILTVLP